MKEMQSTFDTVVEILVNICEIERAAVRLDSNIIEDLGVDSLDFLDVAFQIDKTYNISLPVEEWVELINEGKATSNDYFVMDNLVQRVENLVAAAKAAG
jgi:acyl carrier protein